jgi:hypothetical protein
LSWEKKVARTLEEGSAQKCRGHEVTMK